MPHWVTIDGNHVLLDDDGSSLSDPSYNNDDDFDDEIDDLITEEELDDFFRETAESMDRGITLDELRAEKLGIDLEDIENIEDIAPYLKNMSAGLTPEVRHFKSTVTLLG